MWYSQKSVDLLFRPEREIIDECTKVQNGEIMICISAKTLEW